MLKPSEKIRRLRKARSITQAKLAEMAGIPVVYLTPIESGEIPEMERRLLDALGYRPDMDDMLTELASEDLRGNGEDGASAPSTSSISPAVKAEAA